MEMRIVVPDAAGATALAEQLAVAFGSERVALRDESPEVGVLIDGEPDSAIVSILHAVAGWFEHARVATVELWLGERSYRLARWVPGKT
jgi:hypothetical protein